MRKLKNLFRSVVFGGMLASTACNSVENTADKKSSIEVNEDSLAVENIHKEVSDELSSIGVVVEGGDDKELTNEIRRLNERINFLEDKVDRLNIKSSNDLSSFNTLDDLTLSYKSSALNGVIGVRANIYDSLKNTLNNGASLGIYQPMLVDSNEANTKNKFKTLVLTETNEPFEIIYSDNVTDNFIKTYSYTFNQRAQFLKNKNYQIADYIDLSTGRIVWERKFDGNGDIQEFHNKNRADICKSDSNIICSVQNELPLVATSDSDVSKLNMLSENIDRIYKNNNDFKIASKAFESKYSKSDTKKHFSKLGISDYFLELVLMGLVSQESTWNIGSKSLFGAMGLFQIMPNTGLSVSGGKYTKSDFVKPLKSAEVAVDIFDEKLNYLVNHKKFGKRFVKLPSKVQMYFLIQSYNGGQGTVVKMLKWFFDRVDKDQIPSQYINDDGSFTDEIFFFITTELYMEYNLTGKNKWFKQDSLQYVPKILAWNSLLNDSNSNELTGVTNARDSVVNVKDETEKLDSRLEGKSVKNIEEPKNLTVVNTFSISDEVKGFVQSDKSQDNTKVVKWIKKNDIVAKDNLSGLSTNSDLKKFIKLGVDSGSMVFIKNNGSTLPFVRINTDAVSGISEEWRRAMRKDQALVVNKMTIELNKIIHNQPGSNKNIYVIPVINSISRSVTANNNLQGSSKKSLHLSGSALDFSDKFYYVVRINDDGSLEQWQSTKNLTSYSNMLSKVAYNMSVDDGELFVRFHAGHFHVVPKVKTSLDDQNDLVSKVDNILDDQNLVDISVPKVKVKEVAENEVLEFVVPDVSIEDLKDNYFKPKVISKIRNFNKEYLRKINAKRGEKHSNAIRPGDRLRVKKEWLK